MKERIRRALEPLGMPIYDPGRHAGICKVPYIVLLYGGMYRLNKCGAYERHSVIVYAPLGDCAALDENVRRVRRALSSIVGLDYDTESPDIIEDDFGAYSRTIDYTAHVALQL